MDTDICDKATITVPAKLHLKSSKVTDADDFSMDVPLADSEATEFIFFLLDA